MRWALLLLVACGGGKDDKGLLFDDVQPIFEAKCSPCHFGHGDVAETFTHNHRDSKILATRNSHSKVVAEKTLEVLIIKTTRDDRCGAD